MAVWMDIPLAKIAWNKVNRSELLGVGGQESLKMSLSQSNWCSELYLFPPDLRGLEIDSEQAGLCGVFWYALFLSVLWFSAGDLTTTAI